jgi:hypothetical protein
MHCTWPKGLVESAVANIASVYGLVQSQQEFPV